jgi:thioredoxin reductase (NADPH)
MGSNFFDVIIIGAGPAGLAAAQYAARSNMKTLVVESTTTGGQALQIMSLENFPGLYPPVSGNVYVESMKSQAIHFGVTFLKGTILSLDKIRENFVLKTEKETYSSYTVIIATGAEHRKLGAPGESDFVGRGVSYCATCDGPFFINQKVLVVGGGDSACDEAMYLSSIASHVIIVHRKSRFRAQEQVAQRVFQNPKITVLFNTVVSEIQGTTRVEKVIINNTQEEKKEELSVAGIFIYVGMIPRTDLVEMLPKDADGYIVTDDKMETAVKGLFCAGDVRSKSFRQVVTAVSDGAIAADSAQKYVRYQISKGLK